MSQLTTATFGFSVDIVKYNKYFDDNIKYHKADTTLQDKLGNCSWIFRII